MQLEEFSFDLPSELIAQAPPASRGASRLMILNRSAQRVATGQFPSITEYLHPGDLLVLNDTRVIPARLLGTKETGGAIEVFLVRRLAGEGEEWECLTRCSKTPRSGARLDLGAIQGTVLPGGDPPYRRIRFTCCGDFMESLESVGRMPLPPYIRREPCAEDRNRYQTVFANEAGAVAAPTAGLHFTEEILQALRSKGVEICPITLHVGLGTFLPVRVENIEEHKMHSENYFISETTARSVNRAKAEGRRVIALGTTTTRTLEHAVNEEGELQDGAGVSDLFIYPGFQFRVVDALITNFHLSKSTLLMLVSAFAGREFILSAYRQAVRERFRFFSYGDCMFIE